MIIIIIVKNSRIIKRSLRVVKMTVKCRLNVTLLVNSPSLSHPAHYVFVKSGSIGQGAGATTTAGYM